MAHNGRLWAFDGKDRMRRNGKGGLQGLANQWTIQSVNPSLSQVRGSWLKVLKASKFSSTRGLWPDQACLPRWCPSGTCSRAGGCSPTASAAPPQLRHDLRFPLGQSDDWGTRSSVDGMVTFQHYHSLPSKGTHIFGQENKVNSSPYLRRLSEAWLRPSIMVGLAGIEWG